MIAALHKVWSELGALRVMCGETRALGIAFRVNEAQLAIDAALLDLQPLNTQMPLKMEFPRAKFCE